MVNFSYIQRLSSKQGVPEEIIEKDYLIEFVLSYLGKDKYFKEKLVFRGGTALKKVYFPDYRFSEDLDFLIEDKENLKECEEKLDQLLVKISSENPFQLNKRSEYLNTRLQFFILYDLFSEIKVIKELKIDILKDSYIPTFQKKKILFTYQDFKHQNISINTYKLESVVSDKICRILSVDNEPRDIYDLWHILKLKIEPNKIKKELKKRYGYDMYMPNLLSRIATEEYKRNWQIRLGKQIVSLPRYETIRKELEELIKIKLLSDKV